MGRRTVTPSLNYYQRHTGIRGRPFPLPSPDSSYPQVVSAASSFSLIHQGRPSCIFHPTGLTAVPLPGCYRADLISPRNIQDRPRRWIQRQGGQVTSHPHSCPHPSFRPFLHPSSRPMARPSFFLFPQLVQSSPVHFFPHRPFYAVSRPFLVGLCSPRLSPSSPSPSPY